ncbi:hypothetical protein MLD38_023531 [Melastoma candidum]|uniref:Uncharacterized protein n=1 Tax=Melastoma candidum TaxID=119954 RepID=A0ACB9NUD9_9MYRT|nr:hypothetical protein MLD38_023531 [Melastoma candidum]
MSGCEAEARDGIRLVPSGLGGVKAQQHPMHLNSIRNEIKVDLWNSRLSLGNIEGFNHSAVNSALGACDESSADGPCLPFFVWKIGEHKGLREAVVVMKFDSSKMQVKFPESGICHGLVLWIDWAMDAGDTIVASTRPRQRYWKQGVSQPGPVTCHLSVEASFDPSSSERVVRHATT